MHITVLDMFRAQVVYHRYDNKLRNLFGDDRVDGFCNHTNYETHIDNLEVLRISYKVFPVEAACIYIYRYYPPLRKNIPDVKLWGYMRNGAAKRIAHIQAAEQAGK